MLDLDHARHILVGKDSEGRVWKVHILLNRGIIVENISLNGESLAIGMKLIGAYEGDIASLSQSYAPNLQEILWQPGMGDGKIFAYCHSELQISTFKSKFEVKNEFWISPEGLHIQLSYQGERKLKMGWLVESKHQSSPLNENSIFNLIDSKKNRIKWRNFPFSFESDCNIEVISIGSKTEIKDESIACYIDSALTNSSYKGTLELLFSFTQERRG